MTSPSVTVVVPVHGDRGQLRTTVDALCAQDYPGPFEVVLVDNGGNDASPVLGDRAEALPHRFRVVREPRPGSYAARNAGVRTSRAEVLAFTDADCVPRPEWLREGVAALRAVGGPAFVGGRIAVFRDPAGRVTGAELYELARGFPQEAYLERERFAATANVLVERARFEAVGPFEDGLTSGGDREWGERATAAGLRGVYAPAAVVDHPCRRSLGELRRKVVRVTAGHAQVRRVRGEPEPPRYEVLRELLPPVRTTLRHARSLRGTAPLAPLRYVGVALYVHYLQVVLQLRR